jgi:hypothetical protein
MIVVSPCYFENFFFRKIGPIPLPLRERLGEGYIKRERSEFKTLFLRFFEFAALTSSYTPHLTSPSRGEGFVRAYGTPCFHASSGCTL